MSDRYQVDGAEGEFEPGSGGQVLRNLVSIQTPDDMDELELLLLSQLYDEVLLQQLPDRTLSAADLKHWHQLWLGNVMAVQAGREPLDYSSWEQRKPAYIGAIHAGFSNDYAPMCRFVAEAMAAGNDSHKVSEPA